MTIIFRTTPTGVIVEEIGTKRELDFTYFEFINVVDKLSTANGAKQDAKNPKSPNNSRL